MLWMTGWMSGWGQPGGSLVSWSTHMIMHHVWRSYIPNKSARRTVRYWLPRIGLANVLISRKCSTINGQPQVREHTASSWTGGHYRKGISKHTVNTYYCILCLFYIILTRFLPNYHLNCFSHIVSTHNYILLWHFWNKYQVSPLW